MARVEIDIGGVVAKFEAGPVDALAAYASSHGFNDVEIEPVIGSSVYVTAGPLKVFGNSVEQACRDMLKKMMEEENV